MAKSLRSKIKRRFRTELRKRIGVPHQQKQEAHIQEQLKKAIESQVQGSSFMGLKKLMGGTSAPVATAQVDANAMEIEGDTNKEAHAITEKEVELLNEQDQSKQQAKLASELRKKHKQKNSTKRKKKFVQFHTLRKKGV